MKAKLMWTAVLALILLAAPPLPAKDTIVPAGPSIVVPEPKYDFTEALEGDEVLHDFVVHNRGQKTLEITNVRTG